MKGGGARIKNTKKNTGRDGGTRGEGDRTSRVSGAPVKSKHRSAPKKRHGMKEEIILGDG